MKTVKINSSAHFAKLELIIGIDQLHGRGEWVQWTLPAQEAFFVLANSFVVPLYMDGFLNQL